MRWEAEDWVRHRTEAREKVDAQTGLNPPLRTVKMEDRMVNRGTLEPPKAGNSPQLMVSKKTWLGALHCQERSFANDLKHRKWVLPCRHQEGAQPCGYLMSAQKDTGQM